MRGVTLFVKVCLLLNKWFSFLPQLESNSVGTRKALPVRRAVMAGVDKNCDSGLFQCGSWSLNSLAKRSIAIRSPNNFCRLGWSVFLKPIKFPMDWSPLNIVDLWLSCLPFGGFGLPVSIRLLLSKGGFGKTSPRKSLLWSMMICTSTWITIFRDFQEKGFLLALDYEKAFDTLDPKVTKGTSSRS